MRSRLRDLAVSGFVVLHLLALAWWNVGVIEYRVQPRDEDVISRVRAAVAWLDRAGWLRDGLDGYMRAAGLWQSWILFGPDAPHQTGVVELFGIESIDELGRPVVDPTPLRTTEDPVITERTQLIGNPPCGWTRGDDPRVTFLRGSYARWHAAHSERPYIGAQLVCRTRPIALPGEPSDEAWTRELLWAGPLQGTTR